MNFTSFTALREFCFATSLVQNRALVEVVFFFLCYSFWIDSMERVTPWSLFFHCIGNWKISKEEQEAEHGCGFGILGVGQEIHCFSVASWWNGSIINQNPLDPFRSIPFISICLFIVFIHLLWIYEMPSTFFGFNSYIIPVACCVRS